MTFIFIMNRAIGVMFFLLMCLNLSNGQFGNALFDIMMIAACTVNDSFFREDD